MKKLPALLLATALLSFTAGCRSPGLTKTIVQTAVATGVGFGVLEEPNAIPYMRASAPVICSAAHGTNLSPAEIVEALESSPASKLKTPEAVLIMNGVIGIYTGIWETYGGDIDDRPFLQAGLEGACEGIKLGLPPTEMRGGAPRLHALDWQRKPRIKSK